MDVKYLSVLTTVHNYQPNYTIATSKEDDFKLFILDRVDFSKEDINKDSFLTYDELKDIKLSVKYDEKKDKFNITKGFNLLSEDMAQKIFQNNGLSLDSLEQYFKSLDKNNDNKITTSEINPELNKIAFAGQSVYKKSKLNKIKTEESSNKKKSNIKDKIDGLDKQIDNLKKMLQRLKIKNSTRGSSTIHKNDTDKVLSDSIDKKTMEDSLKDKYGDKDINKLTFTIQHTKLPHKHISQIMYQSGTKADEEEVANLANAMQNVTLNQLDVENNQKANDIEQISPENTPVILDTKNLDNAEVQIQQKIEVLEGLRDELTNSLSENSEEKFLS